MELALYIREIDTQSQFYTMSGKWLHRRSKAARFYVQAFVKPEELTELLKYLPESDIPEAMEDVLQSLPQNVPRDTGKHLVLKMLAFWEDADSVFANSSLYMDTVHTRIADENAFKYATLSEIADVVFPKQIKRLANGDFPKPVLYALHRSLLSHDIGFRVQTRGTLRWGGQYEINSADEAFSTSVVKNVVREHQQNETAQASGEVRNKTSRLERFASQARKLIDASREKRQFTTYGSIGPSKTQTDDGKLLRNGHTGPLISKTQANSTSRSTPPPVSDYPGHIVCFLESWAALDSVSLGSTLNGLASTILRCVDRYNDIDLDKNAAWTFLQEIGIIPPWENRGAYEIRLPHTGRRLQTQSSNLDINEGYRDDTMKALRKDWKDLPVYCIDDVAVHEIDDAISIEPTDVSNEYWVHVHVADPAAHLKMGSDAYVYAENAISTTYMPERVSTMLSSVQAQSRLSLAPNKPCLTFSAKLNLDGEILQYAITPGMVHNVVYMTSDVVKEVTVGELPNVRKTVRTVGAEIPPQGPSRPMQSSGDLSELHKVQLKLLHQISSARTEQLKRRGGLGGITPIALSSKFEVSFRGTSFEPNKPSMKLHSLDFPGDPSIQVTTEEAEVGASHKIDLETNVVQTLMLVAGEVAARWCNERGIPVPYRVTPRNPDKVSPMEYFHLHDLSKRNPDGTMDELKLKAYLQFLGPIQPSSTAGPHANIGVDMMARCTSPLRRFSDLLLHYQVEAAIIEERRTGKSLVGNTSTDFLPFSKAQVEALLPRLDTRERLIAYAQRQTNRHWICQFLLRAWHFKECEIPTVMPYVVRVVNHRKGTMNGTLQTFHAEAECEIPDWTTDEIVEGTTLNVVLTDVNTYWRAIKVKSIGYHGKSPAGTPENG